MYVIGLHDGHNAAVALFKDQELLFALQEERISREKNASGFPQEALAYTLDYHNLKLSDIDKFMLVSNHMLIDEETSTREKVMQRYEEGGTLTRRIKDTLRFTPLYNIWKRRLKKKKLDILHHHGIPPAKVEIVEHHTAHANTAYFCSHFDNQSPILVITADGGGDRLSATINIAQEGQVKRQQSIPDTDSLGRLYSGVTYHMGMVPNEHEYKLMGLAPYAKKEEYRPLLQKFYNILAFEDPNDLVWKRQLKRTTFQILPYLEKILKRQRFDKIAGALQAYTEYMLTELIRRNLNYYETSKVALSGGLFMNVKVNKEIMELPEVEDLFIMPSCGDETNAIGAALHHWTQQSSITKNDIPPLQDSICIGPSISSNSSLKQKLTEYEDDYHIEQPDDIHEKVGQLLADNKVVARVRGRMEFGARALGHRSILANPDSYENVRLINEMIKERDFWMPFAGSMLEEDADQYLKNPKSIHAPYMIMAFDTHTAKSKEIEGAIHPYDRTTRPQVVSQKTDPEYWKVINAFKEKTGISCILNTSFNLHGYPIAYTVEDAMFVMNNSGLQYIAIENFLLKKKAAE